MDNSMDLFDYMRKNTLEQEAPLASRLRPRSLEEIVGQRHILGNAPHPAPPAPPGSAAARSYR